MSLNVHNTMLEQLHRKSTRKQKEFFIFWISILSILNNHVITQTIEFIK